MIGSGPLRTYQIDNENSQETVRGLYPSAHSLSSLCNVLNPQIKPDKVPKRIFLLGGPHNFLSLLKAALGL